MFMALLKIMAYSHFMLVLNIAMFMACV